VRRRTSTRPLTSKDAEFRLHAKPDLSPVAGEDVALLSLDHSSSATSTPASRGLQPWGSARHKGPSQPRRRSRTKCGPGGHADGRTAMRVAQSAATEGKGRSGGCGDATVAIDAQAEGQRETTRQAPPGRLRRDRSPQSRPLVEGSADPCRGVEQRADRAIASACERVVRTAARSSPTDGRRSAARQVVKSFRRGLPKADTLGDPTLRARMIRRMRPPCRPFRSKSSTSWSVRVVGSA
jgi:hypothetical protein